MQTYKATELILSRLKKSQSSYKISCLKKRGVRRRHSSLTDPTPQTVMSNLLSADSSQKTNFSPTSRAAAAAATKNTRNKTPRMHSRLISAAYLKFGEKKLSAWPDEGGEPDLMGPRPAQADVPLGGLS